MYLGSSGTAVIVFGSKGISGCSGIYRIGVAVDVPAALVDSKLTYRP